MKNRILQQYDLSTTNISIPLPNIIRSHLQFELSLGPYFDHRSPWTVTFCRFWLAYQLRHSSLPGLIRIKSFHCIWEKLILPAAHIWEPAPPLTLMFYILFFRLKKWRNELRLITVGFSHLILLLSIQTSPIWRIFTKFLVIASIRRMREVEDQFITLLPARELTRWSSCARGTVIKKCLSLCLSVYVGMADNQ